MALIYEIIDTRGKVAPADWKRLIKFSIRSLDNITLIKNFLSSNNYYYSHPDNIKCKIIEKILDDSNLQDTLNRRKNFWINTRIDRFGKDCFLQRRKDSTKESNNEETISEKIIEEEKKEEIIIEDKINEEPKIIENNPDSINKVIEENQGNNDFIVNLSSNDSSSDDSDSTSDITDSINETSSNEIIEEIPESVEEIPEIPSSEPEPNFNNTEFKFDNIIYNGLDDLMNNINSDISREIVIKTLTGKINKNYKKKYKEVLSKLFIFRDNEWVCVL